MPEKLEIDSGTLITDIERHFRVMAGPGAGKTHWLVNHIKQVVARSKRLSPASRVACISYTNVAVNEIVSRLGSAANQVDVSTIHSFLYHNVVRPYLHLLRDGDGQPLVAFASVDGHDEHHPSYTIVDEWLRSIQQFWILRGTFEEQRKILNDKLCQLVWQHSGGGVWTLGPRTLNRMGKKLNAICTSANLIDYKRRYWSQGIVDHEDILYFAHRILEEHPLICQCLSARYRYLFIDEFQDTQPIQTNVVQWLAGAGTVVGVIGDTEQSIYGFLGAHPQHFLAFSLPDYLDVTMRHNRRSTRRIISILDHVRSDGLRQHSFRELDGQPVTVCIGDVDRSLAAIRADLPPDAVLHMLTRKNKDANRVRSALAPGTVEPWESFYNADAERARFMEHVIAATELAKRGQYAIAHREAARIIGRKGRVRKPLKCDTDLSDVQRKGIAVTVLQEFLTNHTAIFAGTLLDAYVRCGTCVTAAYPAVTLTAAKAGKFKAFAEATPYAHLSGSVRLQEEVRHVRTIHQAKGSEGDNVAVYFEDADRVRHITHSSTAPSDEEKRLTYVALSRARDRLFLCIPANVVINTEELTALDLHVIDLREGEAKRGRSRETLIR
jgi:DNA helicase II / ATP-dependent DNA helicase PcrA